MIEKPVSTRKNPKDHILTNGVGDLFIWHKNIMQWVSTAGLFFDHSVVSNWFDDGNLQVKDLRDQDFLPGGINISQTIGMDDLDVKAYFEGMYGIFSRRNAVLDRDSEIENEG